MNLEVISPASGVYIPYYVGSVFYINTYKEETEYTAVPCSCDRGWVPARLDDGREVKIVCPDCGGKENIKYFFLPYTTSVMVSQPYFSEECNPEGQTGDRLCLYTSAMGPEEGYGASYFLSLTLRGNTFVLNEYQGRDFRVYTTAEAAAEHFAEDSEYFRGIYAE